MAAKIGSSNLNKLDYIGLEVEHLTLLRPKQLQKLLGVSSSTLWRLRQEKKIPEPIAISEGCLGWPQKTIEKWLENKEKGE